MSTSIGGLGVTLGLNYAGFTAGVGVVSNGVGGLVSKFGELGKAALGMVGVGSVIGGLGKAFSGFTKVEENRVTFEALLGSAQHAKKLMSEISEVAYKSSFAGEFANAAKELLKFGFAEESIVPTLKMLGDVAAGTGTNLTEMASLVGASGYRASISKRQLIGLAEAGVPVLQELSGALNLTKDSVLQLADQGGIKMEQLLSVLKNVTGEGGNFHNMMEKRGNTTLGIWTRIEEGVGGAISKFGSVFGDSIAKATGFKDGMAGIADWIEEIRTGMTSLQPAINLVMLSLEALGAIASTVWEGVSQAFQIGWSVIDGVISAFSDSIGTFRDYFVEAMLAVKFVFQNFGDVMAYEFELIKLGLYSFAQDAIHLFTVNIPEILGWFSRNWRNVFTDLWNFTVTIFTNIGKNIWEFFKNIPGLIAGTVELKDIWTPLTEGFKSSITEALQVTKRGLTDYEKEMSTKAEGMRTKLAEGWGKALSEGKLKVEKPTVDFMDQIFELDKKKPFAGTGELAAKVDRQTETKRAGAIEAGTKEAYNVILRSRDAALQPANRTAKATEKMAEQLPILVDHSSQMVGKLNNLPDIAAGAI